MSNVRPDPFYFPTGKTFEFESGIVAAVLARCRGAGARDVDNVLMGEVVGKLAEWVLE
jgi:type VI secretion system protein VasG